MPGPLLVPLLAAGAGLLGTGINAFSQHKTNEANARLSRQMYDKQKADNLAQWHMQNSYNDPTEVMKRLRLAGLNPNLVYGQGSGGGGTASPIPANNADAVRFEAPKVELSDSLMNYMNVKQMEAQTNNVLAQNNVIKQEENLKVAQTAATVLSSAKTAFETQQAKELSRYALEAAKQGVIQRSHDIQRTINQNDQIKAQTGLVRSQKETQDLENNLRRLGINPSDPTWLRAAAQFAAGKSVSDIISGILKFMR